jgi:hypothetical protein
MLHLLLLLLLIIFKQFINDFCNNNREYTMDLGLLLVRSNIFRPKNSSKEILGFLIMSFETS